MIVLSAAWRLFFPAAAAFAGLALPLWLALYTGTAEGPADPLSWHMHEMLFGYLSAALAGFLLTAVPNWTGRPGIKGAPLAGLFTLWLAGRAVMFLAPDAAYAAPIAATFLPVLALVVARDIIATGNRRNLVVIGLIAALSAAELAMLFIDVGQGVTAGFAAALVLMALIGGRITPAFSRNWLKRRGNRALPAPFGLVDRLALGTTAVTGLTWTALGESTPTGAIAGLAALLLLVRLARWQAWQVRGEVLLLAQHAAYLWLVIGAGLLALASLSDLASLSQVRHALGAGAVGSMTVIVMLRATLGHAGRPIEGTRLDWLLFGALHLGAILRVVAGWTGEATGLIVTAGSLWAFAMVLFLFTALPVALAPRKPDRAAP